MMCMYDYLIWEQLLWLVMHVSSIICHYAYNVSNSSTCKVLSLSRYIHVLTTILVSRCMYNYRISYTCIVNIRMCSWHCFNHPVYMVTILYYIYMYSDVYWSLSHVMCVCMYCYACYMTVHTCSQLYMHNLPYVLCTYASAYKHII